ncbi:MAG: ABC transporter permease [Bifidobacteriaceae bacterium]|jgi:peptide/nickel transport system permease protein|nr:ABC transporter permease [Bifidobacteriaceae bacterium]
MTTRTPTAVAAAARPLSGLLRSDWGRFLGSRALTLVVSFAFLAVVTFSIVQLIPGDPARAIAGNEATVEQLAEVRRDLGLDQPIATQFGNYLAGIFDGTLGRSYRTGTVAELISVRIPYTLGVALPAIVVTFLVAIPLGLGVAVATQGGRRRRLGVVFSWITAAVDAVPVYVRAALLVLVFALSLKWLPAGGAQTQAAYVLPITALAIGPICSLSRVARREAEVALEADFVRTLRGWRLPARRIHIKYIAPTLLTSVLTMSGMMLAGMIGGALVMESVFSWPGLGTGVVQAILVKDFPVVQGTILVLGMVAVVVNLVVDIALAVIDPKLLKDGRSH